MFKIKPELRQLTIYIGISVVCVCVKSRFALCATYQNAFLVLLMLATVATSFKVCFVFFSADLNACMKIKS